MNFFSSQDEARKRTRLLVILFVFAVAALIIVTATMVALFFAYIQVQQGQQPFQQSGISPADGFYIKGVFIQWNLLAYTAIATVAVVLIGSLYKSSQLRSGGPAVANALDGKLVQPNTTDPQQRQLLNVVEEMAIASGTPVPPVYVLDEPGINAFAAGSTPRNAVIGVTRGCMNLLNRDQLQGVIAHEFSHILNGDMRLNLRITGLLHGILVIGLLGSALARSSAGHASSGNRNNRNSGGIVILGLGLVVIGYVGTFFGQLIKAAVSRQREFLADASAVQFTRNPQGISEALQKIGGHVFGSRLDNPRAEQFSHMYFGRSTLDGLSSLMATHPPLGERIRRITPRWNGHYPEVSGQPTSPPSVEESCNFNGLNPFQPGSDPAPAPPKPSGQTSLEQVTNTFSAPKTENLTIAEHYLAALPQPLKDAAHDPYTARAIIYALLIKDTESVPQQWSRLKDHADQAVLAKTQELHPAIRVLAPELCLPLFEICIPTLKTLSLPQRHRFRANVVALIKADGKAEVFEWALFKLLEDQLFATEDPPHQFRKQLQQLTQAAQTLLAIFCHLGHQKQDRSMATQAYIKGCQTLGIPAGIMLPREEISLKKLNGSIEQLRQLRILEKPLLLQGLITAIQHDDQVSPAEFELFRVIAACLDCPAPPLFHTH